MDVTSSYEFLINQKSLPDKSSVEYEAFWENEVLKADQGVTINGTYISGWLYWHLNLWTIFIDDKTSGRRKKLHPWLRDNEWMIAEYKEKAFSAHDPSNRKGLIIVGSRRLGKSDSLASIIGRSSTLYEGSENIISAGNDKDIKVITTKVDLGLKELPEYLRFSRIANNWTKEVELGFKDTDDNKYSWSRLLIRNLVDGTNTEALAGATPTEAVIDEIGKNRILECLSALLPGVETPYGWRSSPILAGTGGSFTDGQEAEDIFNNPEAWNFLGVQLKDEPKKYGLFIPGHMSIGVEKDITSLGEYLGKKKKSELDEIPFHKTNWERGEQFIEKKLKEAELSPDPKAVLKARMYYPKIAADCFLSVDNNNFPVEACKAQIKWLEDNNITGQYIRLYRKLDNTVGFKFAERYDLPISQYPPKPEDMRDAPIVVWEMPMDNAPYGMYCAGCLPPGEKVMTDSGLKNVEEVGPQDRLINEKGDPVSIRAFLRYDKVDEDTYTFNLSNTYRTTAFTKEHPILVSSPKWHRNWTVDESSFDFKYVTADKVKEGDWTKVPNIYKTPADYDISTYWDDSDLRRDFRIDNPLNKEDFWWLVGLWLGDGWCESNGRVVSVSFNSREQAYIDKYIEVVRDVLGRKVSIRDRGSCVEAHVCSEALHKFLGDNFGRYALGKFIPEWVKKIMPSLKKHLILGYLNSDGCVTQTKSGYFYTEFVSINQELLEGVQDILFSLGLVSSLTRLRGESKTVFRGKESPTKETYHLRMGHYGSIELSRMVEGHSDLKLSKIDVSKYPKGVKKRKNGCFIDSTGDNIYFKIRKITKSSYTGVVYNFECETHTFLCHHLTTHNCDPYNFNTAEESDSLGTVCIFKRITNLAGDAYQYMPVASLANRPRTMKIWHKQVELLLEFYNAICMPENEGGTFIQYFDKENKIHMLADGYNMLKSISPNTSIKPGARPKGLPATIAVINYCNALAVDYTTEEIQIGEDPQTRMPIMGLGVRRILDKMLLLEMIKYKKGANADRLVAFRHALACAQMLDKFNPIVKIQEEEESAPQSRIITSPFVSIGSPFTTTHSAFSKGRNPFGVQ